MRWDDYVQYWRLLQCAIMWHYFAEAALASSAVHQLGGAGFVLQLQSSLSAVPAPSQRLSADNKEKKYIVCVLSLRHYEPMAVAFC
jgi:hypothetical protein